MKSSEILREAARLVESGGFTFGCMAIASVMGLYESGHGMTEIPKAVMDRFYVVRCNGRESGPWWDIGDSGSRIIGLCLAAAIA